MQEHILIIDNNSEMLELLENTLSSCGYDTLGFLNTKNTIKVIQEEKIDLIIMDINQPDIDGSLYLEMLRSKDIEIPVIFLSDKETPQDIKNAFLMGADDYMTKPFDIEILTLRIKAVLKRYNQGSKKPIQSMQYRDIKLDLNQHKVNIDSTYIDLTKLEMSMLQIFIANKGHVLDREFLLKHIWKGSESIHKKTVNVAMKRLKEKIDPFRNKDYIKTIRGVGYLLA